MDQALGEFTEDGFRIICRELKAARYECARYQERPKGKHVLVRHDVDYSLHRASTLAAIEHQEGVCATYFLNPHSRFYSLLEPESPVLICKICKAGHDIGLHFDSEYYGNPHWTEASLTAALARDRMLLEMITSRSVQSCSYHNPDQSSVSEFAGTKIEWMINASADALYKDYVYCSDSNGYWRHKPMLEVIREGHERLHLLTHPEWWTPKPMAPRSRIVRCVEGRASASMRDYDALLKRSGRENIGEIPEDAGFESGYTP